MSIAIRWTIPFVSVNSKTKYTLNIYDEDFSGTPVQLYGAEEPFTIEEEDDKDQFLPLRTSSGHIGIVLTDDQSDIFPSTSTSRYVTLTTTAAGTIWQGYIKPENDDLEWNVFPLELKLSVVSCMGVLEDIQITGEDFSLKTFGELIHEAVTASGMTCNYVYFPLEWGTSSTASGLGILNAKILRGAFFEETNTDIESPEYHKYDGDSYSDVLTKICTFLGWSMYESGTRLVFTTNTATKYGFVAFSNLTNQSASVSTLTPRDAPPASYASDDHSQSTVASAYSIKINANADEVDTIMDAIDTEQTCVTIGSQFNSTSTEAAVSGMPLMAGKLAIGYNYTINDEEAELVCHEYQVDYINNEGEDPIVEQVSEEAPWDFYRFFTFDDGKASGGMSSDATHIGAKLVKADIFTSTAASSKTKLDYNDAVLVVASFAQSTVDPLPYIVPTADQLKACPLITIKSKHPFCFSDGLICLKAESLTNFEGLENYYALLKFGDMYWNGASWTSTESWFIFNKAQQDKAHYYELPNYNEADGTAIEVSDSLMLEGLIEFRLALMLPQSGPYADSIQSIKITLLKPDLYSGKERKNSNTYYRKVSSTGDKKVVDLDILTMSDNVTCENCLYYGTTYLKGQLYYNGALCRPENALLDKMARAYSKKRKVLKITTAYTNVFPYVTYAIDGVSYRILARSHNYRENETTITLIER